MDVYTQDSEYYWRQYWIPANSVAIIASTCSGPSDGGKMVWNCSSGNAWTIYDGAVDPSYGSQGPNLLVIKCNQDSVINVRIHWSGVIAVRVP